MVLRKPNKTVSLMVFALSEWRNRTVCSELLGAHGQIFPVNEKHPRMYVLHQAVASFPDLIKRTLFAVSRNGGYQISTTLRIKTGGGPMPLSYGVLGTRPLALSMASTVTLSS